MSIDDLGVQAVSLIITPAIKPGKTQPDLKVKTDILTSTFMRFRSRLHYLAARIAGDDDAEDVIHDAFCRLWSRHPEVLSETDAVRLAYTTVRNQAIDVFRHTSVHPKADVETSCDYMCDDEDYSSQKECQETYDAVIRLSKRILSARQYEIFRRHDIDGEAYQEIAMDLGMSQENVRMTLSRARKIIRDVFRQIQDK